jgi:hypothetical protein
MPKEPLENIGIVCKEHEPKPGKFIGKDPSSFIGKFVKLGFITKNPRYKTEHMWVKVESLGTHGTELEGVLDSDPVFDVGYECGDGVGFDVSEIEQVEDGEANA